jgi:hypothetical protein
VWDAAEGAYTGFLDFRDLIGFAVHVHKQKKHKGSPLKKHQEEVVVGSPVDTAAPPGTVEFLDRWGCVWCVVCACVCVCCACVCVCVCCVCVVCVCVYVCVYPRAQQLRHSSTLNRSFTPLSHITHVHRFLATAGSSLQGGMQATNPEKSPSLNSLVGGGFTASTNE